MVQYMTKTSAHLFPKRCNQIRLLLFRCVHSHSANHQLSVRLHFHACRHMTSWSSTVSRVTRTNKSGMKPRLTQQRNPRPLLPSSPSPYPPSHSLVPHPSHPHQGGKLQAQMPSFELVSRGRAGADGVGGSVGRRRMSCSYEDQLILLEYM
jgi:hypothetical protein